MFRLSLVIMSVLQIRSLVIISLAFVITHQNVLMKLNQILRFLSKLGRLRIGLVLTTLTCVSVVMVLLMNSEIMENVFVKEKEKFGMMTNKDVK